MDINGITEDYYQAGYVNNKTAQVEEGKSFAEIASQKVAEADKQYCMDRASEAFDTIGSHAPDKVRQAWTEAEKESGVDGHITKCGLWISNDGKLCSKCNQCR